MVATSAGAGLRLCNRTSYILYAATAVVQESQAAMQGWTRLIPGTCQDALAGALLPRAGYYVYARSSFGHSGPTRAWGGDQPLCVKDGPFSLKTPLGVSHCPSDDTFTLPFARIDTRRRKAWAMTFDDNPPFRTMADAAKAGLKRLLRDQGAKVGALDARPDKAAESAMAAFRRRLNMAPGATAANLFDALETEALKTSAPLGYSVCNDTAKPIWVALGFKSAGKWVTRGWWKIAASGCAKALAEPLATDSVFILAQTPGGVPIVYGKEKFCTTNVEFDIQNRGNCKARGLVEAGFAQTRVKGVEGYTAHVSENGLVMMPKRYSATPK
ncbi:MAG TPA: DUF1036 domain-containing protein [Rhizomicrobium sp.]|nr:DUF1036 domain-containing protein [Rhizomicrobium sp.]